MYAIRTITVHDEFCMTHSHIVLDNVVVYFDLIAEGSDGEVKQVVAWLKSCTPPQVRAEAMEEGQLFVGEADLQNKIIKIKT